MHVLEQQKIPHGDIQLLLTICEEIGLAGAAAMDPSRIKARYGFVLDSGPPVGSCVYHAPTHEIIEVWIKGQPSHAGAAPEQGISAIVAAAKAISKMKLGRIDPHTTANIGIVHGGTAINIIPAEVYLKGEARSRVPARLDAQREHMLSTFQSAAQEMGATCETRVVRAYDGYELGMDSPVLTIAEKAAKLCGLEFVLRASGGGSDANIFNAAGVPTTVLGCGMQNIHRHDEFVTIPDMIKSANLVLSVVRTAAEWRC
jgi:tripeptide aminopeptidase